MQDALSNSPRKLSLEEVLVTPKLGERPITSADQAVTDRAILKLTRHLSEHPARIFSRLAKTAQSLCGADSAGISILEKKDGKEMFCWRAVEGAYAKYLNGTMPRESPCGVVVDRNAAQLFSFPERHYEFGAQIDPSIVEALLEPFRVDGLTVGTLWVLSHSEAKKFDQGHSQMLGELSGFATTAYQMLASLGYLEAAKGRTATKALGTLRGTVGVPPTPAGG